MAVPEVPLRVITHAKKVCSLYKRAYRCLESHIRSRPHLRYEAALLRNRFEQNRCLADNVKAVELLVNGEEELRQKMHCIPLKFANSYGGLTFEREILPPDSVLDFWHPLEKAQYPEYFARREKRKKEFVQWWEKTYGGKPTATNEPGH